GTSLISLTMRPLLTGVPYNGNIPFLCSKGGNVVHFQNHFISKVGISTTRVAIPEGSMLRDFPFGMKVLSAFWDASNVIVKEPEFAPVRGIKRAENVLGEPIGKGICKGR
ncbi:MAG TPA: hypothetical protein VJM83_01345, partial [Nitrospirota bacterium]|nr:hypothetical protein [Nitrospirota bacterium]